MPYDTTISAFARPTYIIANATELLPVIVSSEFNVFFRTGPAQHLARRT